MCGNNAIIGIYYQIFRNMDNKPHLTLGIFTDRLSAESAISILSKEGFGTEEISIITKEKVENGNAAGAVAEGAVSGATAGGILGGLAGLLVGIGAVTIPGIGALLIGGPLAAALGLTGAAAVTVSGVATGALAGGFVGALMGLGLPEEQARVYEEKVKSGAVILAVSARDATNQSRVREILTQAGADQVRTVGGA
jgi:hypothetical protein